jgi:tetratricopeptide (TPR) repeat protein
VAKERFDASEPGGLWAIMVDTDERIDTHGEDVRAILAASNAECAMVMHHSETHVRERIFRLPAKGSFNGPTHEAYTAQPRDQLLVLEKTRCFELEKTPEDYQKKFERDARVLAAYTKENPWDPRWFYYYGDALQSLRRFEEATAAYDECAKLRGWNEESAWACYRAAECWCALEKYEKAVDACAAGLARHSGIAELAWLAGYASWQLGKVDQAVFWSHLAISMGLFRGKGADVHRIGFRNVRALFEGPYDVLRYALRAMGDIVGADVAEVLMKEATAAREAYGRKAT